MTELTGHPLERWGLAKTGKTQHLRIWRLGVATALCDPALRLYDDRDAETTRFPICRRCSMAMENGTFVEVLRVQRLGRAS